MHSLLPFLGIAAALKQPHALDGLCGSIRLVAVPAEEMIQLAFREELRQKGIIKYNGGKTEFMYRGLLDGVDMAMMVHGMTKGTGVNEDGDTDLDFHAQLGMNGCMAKNIRYKGKSAHAGGAPHMGVNAEYAAMLRVCRPAMTCARPSRKKIHPFSSDLNGCKLCCKHHPG